MDYFCNKCSSETKLVKKSSSNFGCPRCHTQFELNDDHNLRLAQFGGNIAKPTMYGPGSSPVFKGLSNKNRGTNTRLETSFDAIISRTHRPAPIDPERNLEKRLEQFHDHLEEDSIPYELNIKERARLKVRKEIRRREKFYEDAAKKIEENSVSFIKEHFNPSENQVKTLEESLSSKRKYEDVKNKSILDDESPDQIKPERRHTLAKMKGVLTTVFDPLVSETDVKHDYNPKFLNNAPFDGVFNGTLENNKQLNDYLRTKNFDLGIFLNKNTNMDFPNPEETYSTNFMSSDLPSKVIKKFDPQDDSIEEGLNELLQSPEVENLPQIKSPNDVNRDKQLGNDKKSIFQNYPIAPVGTTPLPK